MADFHEDSGLQVVDQTLERPASAEKVPVAPDDSEKIPQHLDHAKTSDGTAAYAADQGRWASTDPEAVGLTTDPRMAYSAAVTGGLTYPPPPERNPGRRRWMIWIAVAVGGVVLLAVVLGSVLGTQLNKGNHAASNQGKAATPTPTTAQAAISSASVTTQTIPLPSETILSDCPSSNNTMLTVGGAQYHKLCGVSLFNPQNPNSNITGVITHSLDACIQACAGQNTNGQVSCNTVCWKNSKAAPNVGGPGACYGYVGVNTTDQNPNFPEGDYTHNTDCDAAYWINQPAS